jgi:hypothetical protein
VDDRLAVKLGSAHWAPSRIADAPSGQRWTVALTGYGFKVWVRSRPGPESPRTPARISI